MLLLRHPTPYRNVVKLSKPNVQARKIRLSMVDQAQDNQATGG